MKTTLKFFKDMGVCDGAYAVLDRVFAAANVTEYDYDAGYGYMLSIMDHLESEASNSGDPEHSTAQGWLAWCYELRNRPEAIMYFGDHIENNLFRTSDTLDHESLDAALNHNRRRYAESRGDYLNLYVINGVYRDDSGNEVWKRISDIQNTNISKYEAFVWYDAGSGLNHKTKSPTEALVFASKIEDTLDAMAANEAAEVVRKMVTDESGQYSVWVDVK